MRVRLTAAVTCLLGVLSPTTSAGGAQTIKKSVWGEPPRNGVSQFPMYRELGVGLYQTALAWHGVAPVRPANPTDPNDSAYRWPAELDATIAEARRYGMQVSLQLIFAPPWANGGRPKQWAPNPQDFADFASAAARRYPTIKHWMVWGEPSKQQNFQPLPKQQATGPRIYARILEAAYRSLKGVDRRNIVIGGNTFFTGDVSPLQFIRSMRLPNGRPPRFDLYGHNPFTDRAPDLRKRYRGGGFADFSDLDTLAGWVDRYLPQPGRRRPKLFLSEFYVSSDHTNYETNVCVSRRTQADWVARGLRIVRQSPRIYTLGWIRLYD